MPKEWMRDLDEEAVEREAHFEIRPRLDLPEIGESIVVTFLSEPRVVPRSQTGLERDMFVADVDDGSGIEKQIICPKSLRQHLAALLKRGDIERIEGSALVISAHMIPEFKTKEGKIIQNAKVYRVDLPKRE